MYHHKRVIVREIMADKKRKKAAPKTAKTARETREVPEVAPAPKDGPAVTLRMRSEAQINRIKAAAARAEMSMNTWVCEVLDRAAAASA